MSYLLLDSIKIFLALSISIDVVSGCTDKKKREYREKNGSGIYHIVGIVNDRPGYKVSFCKWQKTLPIKGLLMFNFSEPKKMKMVMKYISGIMGHNGSGVWHHIQISKPVCWMYNCAGCTSILKASTISEYIRNERLYIWFSRLKTNV